jgi:DNA polymerase
MEGFFDMHRFKKERPVTNLAPKCGACGLYKKCDSPKMEPHGHGRGKILIVGESPGEEEDAKGEPFVGASGKFLRENVLRCGVNWTRDLLVTNAVICHPPDNKFPKKGREIEWCRPNLLKTIKDFKPKVIVTLGRSALESMIGQVWLSDIGTMERWAGFQIPLNGAWLCPTWHPSFLLRSRDKMMDRMFHEHLDRAFSIKKDAPAPLSLDVVEKIYNIQHIREMLRWFKKKGGLQAFDYETNCLKPEYPKSQIYSASVSNGERTIAFPWMTGVEEIFSDYLRAEGIMRLASNIKFEERWTVRKLGHGVRGWEWDSVLAAHCIDNRPNICSLKFQAFVLLGVGTYTQDVDGFLSAPDGGFYNRVHEIPIDDLLQYNGIDSYLEVLVARKQRKIMGLTPSGKQKKYYNSRVS